MKRATLKAFLIHLIIVCGGFLFFSCGLDTYIVMDSPISVGYEANYESIDAANHYFQFTTNETGGYPSGFNFLGTEVYYKIYNNATSLLSEKESLISISEKTETSAKAATSLIETYSFKTLKIENYNSSPLIAENGKNRVVTIRLTNYQNLEEFSARVLVDGDYIFGNAKNSKPVRTDGTHTFDFGRTGEYDSEPVSTDNSVSTGIGDVKYGSFTSEKKWYVSMFAVAVGRDGTYTNYYSNILYLGAVPIDASTADN